MKDNVRDDSAEEERQKESKPEKSGGMDWESMGKDVFAILALTFCGFMASSILLPMFKPELATPWNAVQCGMAYAMLVFGLRVTKH